MEKVHETEKKQWVKPCLTIYGDMSTLTQAPKLKDFGLGDDFNTNISTVGGP